MKKTAVVGSGFSGLSAACFLAQAGFEVTLFEKNATAGGRARKFESDGFVFDMGPSWYWMPDVFDRFFERFGKKVSDYYALDRLDPSYRVFFSALERWDIPSSMEGLSQLFESHEPGSSVQLNKFLKESQYKYEVGIHDLVYNPGLSIFELFDIRLLLGMMKLHVFQPISKYIRKYFSDPKLIQLLEFPVLFLGAAPNQTPALYSLMNYADLSLGTWYPKGGMSQIVEAMVSLAQELGVRMVFNAPVTSIEVQNNRATGLIVNGARQEFDVIVAGADYHHVEQELLPARYRNYSPSYWEKRRMAPSSLIFYLGINKRLDNLIHHNLFFDQDFSAHTDSIYKHPEWPENPLFYVCCPSQTDPTVAPEGHENLFILIPVAPGLSDDDAIREKYYDLVMNRLENLTHQSIRPHVIFKRSYAHRDFTADYHSFKGNAYGLANTLMQTANLKPSIKNKRLDNLFYTGQLTVPGPGVPPSLISGEVVAREIIGKNRKEK